MSQNTPKVPVPLEQIYQLIDKLSEIYNLTQLDKNYFMLHYKEKPLAVKAVIIDLISDQEPNMPSFVELGRRILAMQDEVDRKGTL